jgi:hypothetical protein
VKKITTASFEFLATVLMQIPVFWNDVPRGLEIIKMFRMGKLHPSSESIAAKCFGL